MTRIRRTRRGWPLFLLGGMALAGLPAAVAAQDVEVRERDSCRCVDRDGNEIADCTCLRTPRLTLRGVAPMAGTLDRRARIGVWVEEGEAGSPGALITDVQEDGPAQAAGVRPGDVVVEVGGHSLSRPLPEGEDTLDDAGSLPVQRFVRLVGTLEPGEPMEMVVLRDGERRTLQVTPERPEGGVMVFRGEGGSAPRVFMDAPRVRLRMEELGALEGELRRRMEGAERSWTVPGGPDGNRVWRFRVDPEGARSFSVLVDSLDGPGTFRFFGADPCLTLHRSGGRGLPALAGGSCLDGVEFLDLNPELGAYFDADEGVLVVEVAEESTLGLRPGDVLVGVDGRAVAEVADARRILASYEAGEEVRLRVIREGREMEVLGRRVER